MKTIMEGLDNDAVRVVLGVLIALISGAIRVCGNPEHQTWKMIVSSVLTAGLAGFITAAMFYSAIPDRYIFGVVCALGGYSGQLVLVITSKQFEKLLLGRFDK